MSGQVLYCKVRKQGLSSVQRQVFYRITRIQAAVLLGMKKYGIFPCFPHSTLPLASEQILKICKYPEGTNMEVQRVDLANWVLRTSPKFTTGVKYQFNHDFDQIRDPEIPINLRLTLGAPR